MLLFVAFLFLGFIAMQWLIYQQSARRPEVWGLSKRRMKRMAREANPELAQRLLEAADGGPKPTMPPVMIAALAMTLIAIVVLLWF